jgi:Arc/MetJ family transcription regulator
MRTNIVLDDDLVAEAFRVSRARTKKDLVHEALRELVQARRRRSLLDLKGKVRLAKGYNYKKARIGP